MRDCGTGRAQAGSGKNALTIHLTQFVEARSESCLPVGGGLPVWLTEAGQILRVWCFLSDSPAYVFPPDLEGVQARCSQNHRITETGMLFLLDSECDKVAVPLSMKTPRADFLPSKGWHSSLHRLLARISCNTETEYESRATTWTWQR